MAPLRSLYIRPGRRAYLNQFFPTSTLIGYPKQLLNPYSEQWTIGIERRLPRNWVLSVDYVGSHTSRINRPLDVDPPAPFIRTAPGQIRTRAGRQLHASLLDLLVQPARADRATRPRPPIRSRPIRVIQSDVNDGYANYDALDVNLTPPFQRPSRMLVSYTWSHTLDNVDPDVPGQNPNDPNFTGRVENGNAIFDQRHRFVLSGVYILPLDIHFGGVFSLSSGLPYNIVTGANNSGDTGATTDRPVINGVVIGAQCGPRQSDLRHLAVPRTHVRAGYGAGAPGGAGRGVQRLQSPQLCRLQRHVRQRRDGGRGLRLAAGGHYESAAGAVAAVLGKGDFLAASTRASSEPRPSGGEKKSNGRRWTRINADENKMPIRVHRRSSAAHQCFLHSFSGSGRKRRDGACGRIDFIVPTPDDETRFMAPLQAAPLPQRYEMLGELGRGGMGIVCKVRDRETGEVLAIKILKPEIAANPQILERFKNELLLAHKITDRHVARLYEFHRAGDAVYLSMEFVEGESLRSLLEREGRLEVGRAMEFARQIAGGLAEAHRQSIVHRDLKPENIMIGPGGELKVMDFGISRSYAEDATVTGSVVGTPAYMAPEQAEGKTLDHRTDIYAFGLVLYEMFTGEAAFHGDTAVTVALKQIRERPRKPTTLTPSLPKRVESAILKCLEKDPAARFQSVDDAFRTLEGKATPAVPKAAKPARRRFLLTAIGAAIVAAAGAGVWWNLRSSDSVRFPLEQFTLANGLTVALSPDHASPTFTLAVSYRAGLRRDTPGHAGVSHLVQHIMYEGSPNVARGEYKDLVGAAGGNLDGGTTPDVTMFWTTLPANQLDLALFLEADRMRGLEITTEGLNAARAGLLEERARAMGSGYATARFRFNALAYDNFVNQQSGFAHRRRTEPRHRGRRSQVLSDLLHHVQRRPRAGGRFRFRQGARAHTALLREHSGPRGAARD